MMYRVCVRWMAVVVRYISAYVLCFFVVVTLTDIPFSVVIQQTACHIMCWLHFFRCSVYKYMFRSTFPSDIYVARFRLWKHKSFVLSRDSQSSNSYSLLYRCTETSQTCIAGNLQNNNISSPKIIKIKLENVDYSTRDLRNRGWRSLWNAADSFPEIVIQLLRWFLLTKRKVVDCSSPFPH